MARNIALSDQVKIWEQNLVSRLVGFFVRTIVIAISLLIMAILSIALGAILVIWFLLPFLVFLLPVVGLIVVYR